MVPINARTQKRSPRRGDPTHADLERYGVAWWRGHHHQDAVGGIRMEYSGQTRRFDRKLTESVDSGKILPVKAEVSTPSSILGNLKS